MFVVVLLLYTVDPAWKAWKSKRKEVATFLDNG